MLCKEVHFPKFDFHWYSFLKLICLKTCLWLRSQSGSPLSHIPSSVTFCPLYKDAPFTQLSMVHFPIMEKYFYPRAAKKGSKILGSSIKAS